MKQPWQATVWGVRGSFPMTGTEYGEYGGNTSCLSVDCGEALVVLDAGSGLAGLGQWLTAEKENAVEVSGQGGGPDRPAPGKDRRADILISHLHLDHVLGLFSFPPFFEPDWEIHLYGEARDGRSFRAQLQTLLGPPYWPVGLEEFPASVHLHEVEAGKSFVLAGGAAPGLRIDALRGNHPGQSLFFRLEPKDRPEGGIVYALDCEPDEETEAALLRFAKGAGLLVWDANFAPGKERPGWGHSTWQKGLSIGSRAGVRQVLMTHYAREYEDGFLRRQECLARQAGPSCLFAREGMVLLI